MAMGGLPQGRRCLKVGSGLVPEMGRSKSLFQTSDAARSIRMGYEVISPTLDIAIILTFDIGLASRQS